MANKNIFAGFGLRTEFVNRIYNELMKRNFLTYADVLAAYYGRPQGYYNKISYNSEVDDVEYIPALTKPLHHSQRETLPFGEHGGQWYGEVRLTIEPNRELRGRILLYGENLEVVSPQSLREQIKDTLTKQMAQYRE